MSLELEQNGEPEQLAAPSAPFAQPEPPVYSAPSQPATPPPAPPAPPRKVRRVGTLTMGLSLVMTGVVIMIYMFNPRFDILTIAKFCPIVLVLIGLEILYHSFFHREDKIKYDFLSGFVCFILICASACAAIIPPMYEQFGPNRDTVQQTISSDIENQCRTALAGIPISRFSCNVYLNRLLESDAALTNTLTPSDYVRIEIQLSSVYTDKQKFAQDCKTILDKLSAANIRYNDLYFESLENTSKKIHTLSVSDSFRSALSADKLALVVDDDNMTDLQQELQQQYDELERTQQQQQAELERQYDELEQSRQQQQDELEQQRNEMEQSRQQQQQELEQQRNEMEQSRQQQQEELNRQQQQATAG